MKRAMIIIVGGIIFEYVFLFASHTFIYRTRHENPRKLCKKTMRLVFPPFYQEVRKIKGTGRYDTIWYIRYIYGTSSHLMQGGEFVPMSLLM